jgi:hypothetical protein
MVLEELVFVLESRSNALVRLYIALSSVHDWDITQAKRNDSTRKNINYIGASIPASMSALLSKP